RKDWERLAAAHATDGRPKKKRGHLDPASSWMHWLLDSGEGQAVAALVGSATAGVASPAAMPATPISRWRKLSSVLTGTIERIEWLSPMMKPQIATTM